jgi:hypothetical protein
MVKSAARDILVSILTYTFGAAFPLSIPKGRTPGSAGVAVAV